MKNRLSVIYSLIVVLVTIFASAISSSAYNSLSVGTGDSTTIIIVILAIVMIAAVVSIILLSRKK